MAQNRFKILRESMGLSQLELGEKLGVTQQSVFAWERGETVPRLQTAVILADLYGVSIDYLLGHDDQNEKEPTVDDDGLRAMALKRVKALSDPALGRVMDFLDGLQAGQDIAAAQAAAPGSAGSGSSRSGAS